MVTAAEVIAEPHLEAQGFWDTVDHPEVGPYRQVSTPWKLSKSPGKLPVRRPVWASRTDYVLGELLGLSAQEIATLEAQGIIRYATSLLPLPHRGGKSSGEGEVAAHDT